LRGNSAGFTLLEVLVALAVVAIAMGALLKSGVGGTATAMHLEEKLFANWVATNRLAEMQVGPEWPAVGETTGMSPMAGRDWYWRQSVSATPDSDMRRVDIEVGGTQQGFITRAVAYVRKR
jgi:general secretion pathway protein I